MSITINVNLYSEIRKQQFEERRREFEDLRKKKKPAGEPKKRKMKGNKDQMFPQDMFGEGQMMMQPGSQPPPKKRQRRQKKKANVEEDKDARVESFLTQLRLLANVPLQEPKVTSAIVNSPVYGSAQTLTGKPLSLLLNSVMSDQAKWLNIRNVLKDKFES